MPGSNQTIIRRDPAKGTTFEDLVVAGGVLLFAALVSLFAIRNNDIWWMLATARRLLETKSFITQDPFTFTTTGYPWAPQSWLSSLVFYSVHSLTGLWGLIVVRALLVVSIFSVMLRTLRRVGAKWAFSAPLLAFSDPLQAFS